MKEKIAIVVVTFNRLNLLRECIAVLQKQTCPADAIIVINNNSTDGTSDWLNTQESLTVVHQENLGGAGGFHRGIKEAYETGYDWVWVMDDDVEPAVDCLENLMKYTSISECIHPIRKYLDGEVVDGELIWDLTRNSMLFLSNRSLKNGKEYWTINNACFEGMLISKKLIEKIGFPDPRFFIVYDDFIYGFYASLYTNVIVVKSALMIRKKLSSTEKWSPMYMYYSMRNLFLIEEYKEKFFPLSSKKEIKKTHFRAPISNARMILKLRDYSITQKKKLLFAVFKGYIDGRQKKVGKSF
jgi:GT2 family glycosyltransferase